MRLSVRFNGKWFVLPCGKGDNSIQWLIEETILRSQGINSETEKVQLIAQNLDAVLAQSGGILGLNDAIKDTLNDSDFVHLTGESRVRYRFEFTGSFTSFILQGPPRISVSFESLEGNICNIEISHNSIH